VSIIADEAQYAFGSCAPAARPSTFGFQNPETCNASPRRATRAGVTPLWRRGKQNTSFLSPSRGALRAFGSSPSLLRRNTIDDRRSLRRREQIRATSANYGRSGRRHKSGTAVAEAHAAETIESPDRCCALSMPLLPCRPGAWRSGGCVHCH